MTFMCRRYMPKTKPPVPRKDLQQPRSRRRKADRHQRHRSRLPGQQGQEANHVGSLRLICERVPGNKPENLAALADHDLGVKWQPACYFSAEFRLGDRPSDHQRARRTNVDHVEVLQLLGKLRGSKSPVTSDVDASQEYHEGHASSPAGIPNRLRISRRPGVVTASALLCRSCVTHLFFSATSSSAAPSAPPRCGRRSLQSTQA